MKLNLGCGYDHREGYINVDKFEACNPDEVLDLDLARLYLWPWADESVTEIQAHHILEHLGQTPEGFIAIMQEMYRILVDGGMVYITVPHYRNDSFWGDPTHVRVINSNVMSLFSQKFNHQCIKEGWSSSTLGLYHNIDFDVVEITEHLAGPWAKLYESATNDAERDFVATAARERWNVISDTRMILRKVKH